MLHLSTTNIMDTDAKMYTPPPWAGEPKQPLYIDVIREGSILEQHKLTGKDHFYIGSSQNASIVYPNPFVSRFHAVIQFKPDGSAFIMDLNSTHGTWHGDKRLPLGEFSPLKNGDRLTFGNPNPKRTFIVREASATDYPDAVTRRPAKGVSSKSSTATAPMFDDKGRLLDSAKRALLTSIVASNARNTKDDASDTWDFERAEDADLSTNDLHECLNHYMDDATGILRVHDVKQSRSFSSFSPLQLDIFKQIEAAYKRLETVRRKCAEEDAYCENSTLQASMNERIDEVKLLQQRLFASLNGTDDDDDDQEKTSAALTLSASVKEALDERLFDEDDTYYDRSDDWNQRVAVPHENLCSEEDQRNPCVKASIPPSALHQKHQSATTHQLGNNEVTSAEGGEGEDDDALDKFMRENAAQLKLAAQKRQTTTQFPGAAKKQQIPLSPKGSTRIEVSTYPESTAETSQKLSEERSAASYGSSHHTKKNRAMHQASQVLAQINQTHQSNKQHIHYDSPDDPDSPFTLE